MDKQTFVLIIYLFSRYFFPVSSRKILVKFQEHYCSYASHFDIETLFQSPCLILQGFLRRGSTQNNFYFTDLMALLREECYNRMQMTYISLH